MIGQYLSNKNESATVAKSEIFSELNKANIVDVQAEAHEYYSTPCLFRTCFIIFLCVTSFFLFQLNFRLNFSDQQTGSVSNIVVLLFLFDKYYQIMD